MQFNFFKNLCVNLMNNDYKPVYGTFESQAITELSKFIAFSRTVGSSLYTVFIIRTDITPGYQAMLKDYAAKLSTDIAVNGYDDSGRAIALRFRNKVLLALLITDEPNEELLDFANITGIIGNEEFIEMRWIIDPIKQTVSAPGEQPSALNGIEKLVKASFTQSTDNTATTLGGEYGKIREKNRIKTKTQSTYGVYSLTVIIILVYAFQYASQALLGERIVERLGMLYPVAVTQYGEYYRLLTSIFLHADIMHLCANCLSLYIFGSRTEKYYGSGFFMMIFIVSGIAASLATVFFYPPDIPSLGASGAVFGLEGAVFSCILMNKGNLDGVDFNTILMLSIFGIAFGFMEANVNNAAHIVGFISGILISIPYMAVSKRKNKA